MEALSGIASATQLLAYSHSTFKVILRLYKQLKSGPDELKHQQSSVRVLLSIVDSLHKHSVPAHVLTTLLELSNLAIEALNLIDQSQRIGFFGLRWATVRYGSALSDVFAALKDKRDSLHFAISVETRQAVLDTGRQRRGMPVLPTSRVKKWLKDHGLSSIKHTSKGSRNQNIIGNGEVTRGNIRRVQTEIHGDDGFNYVGNTGDFDRKKHAPPDRSSEYRDDGPPLHEAGRHTHQSELVPRSARRDSSFHRSQHRYQQGRIEQEERSSSDSLFTPESSPVERPTRGLFSRR